METSKRTNLGYFKNSRILYINDRKLMQRRAQGLFCRIQWPHHGLADLLLLRHVDTFNRMSCRKFSACRYDTSVT